VESFTYYALCSPLTDVRFPHFRLFELTTLTRDKSRQKTLLQQRFRLEENLPAVKTPALAFAERRIYLGGVPIIPMNTTGLVSSGHRKSMAEWKRSVGLGTKPVRRDFQSSSAANNEQLRYRKVNEPLARKRSGGRLRSDSSRSMVS
jgi:hypothetical protein